ncbi:MAG: MmgE/PrpD family protein [Chloroflexi bacterium]|nr:MmgE/PrpD family protein [Chloroflexota bacterium]
MLSPMGHTQLIAEFALGTPFDGLSGQVVSISKDMMLNAAAVALAGAAQPEALALTRFAQEMGGNGKCTIVGMGLRTSPVYAALANGTMVHLLDFDDEVVDRGIHLSSAVFPVVMALGEMNGYAGKDVLTAFAVGCEVASKLAGLVGPGLATNGLGVAAAIGATMAAGRLLGLDQEEMENALGIACGSGGWSRADLVFPSRPLQHGRAAMNGTMAVLLARRTFGRFESSRQAIEAPGGFLDCYIDPDSAPSIPDPEALLSQLGNPFDVVHPGVTIKPYPCESAGHTTIDAVLQLVQQYRIDPGEVRSARVTVSPATLQAMPYPCPQSGREARCSLTYLTAAALLHGAPLIEQFTDSAVQDPPVRELMARVMVDASMKSTSESSPLASQASTVTLDMVDGRQLGHRVEVPRGHPELPLDQDDLEAKFLYCSRYILPPDHIEGAVEQFRDLENVRDITGLASILGG